MPSWTVATVHGSTLSRNAIEQLRSKDSTCLQFKMVDGAHQVLWLLRRSTSMANRLFVRQMVRVDHGPIKCITSKVSTQSQTH